MKYIDTLLLTLDTFLRQELRNANPIVVTSLFFHNRKDSVQGLCTIRAEPPHQVCNSQARNAQRLCTTPMTYLPPSHFGSMG
ncbi:hypothetical protein HMPREF1146_0198 [Prevotella sp. MSX73]|nr:hypothetical protein HMPREF1146_0198 [Prevotella sp. MSX73]